MMGFIYAATTMMTKKMTMTMMMTMMTMMMTMTMKIMTMMMMKMLKKNINSAAPDEQPDREAGTVLELRAFQILEFLLCQISSFSSPSKLSSPSSAPFKSKF